MQNIIECVLADWLTDGYVYECKYILHVFGVYLCVRVCECVCACLYCIRL